MMRSKTVAGEIKNEITRELEISQTSFYLGTTQNMVVRFVDAA